MYLRIRGPSRGQSPPIDRRVEPRARALPTRSPAPPRARDAPLPFDQRRGRGLELLLAQDPDALVAVDRVAVAEHGEAHRARLVDDLAMLVLDWDHHVLLTPHLLLHRHEIPHHLPGERDHPHEVVRRELILVKDLEPEVPLLGLLLFDVELREAPPPPPPPRGRGRGSQILRSCRREAGALSRRRRARGPPQQARCVPRWSRSTRFRIERGRWAGRGGRERDGAVARRACARAVNKRVGGWLPGDGKEDARVHVVVKHAGLADQFFAPVHVDISAKERDCAI